MDSFSNIKSDHNFDLETISRKYEQERLRRLRPEGDAQYLEATGNFAHIADFDTFARKVSPRPPITEKFEVVVVGGGFSGLLAGARLREAGITDFRIVEWGGDFGGTWYWNRYPGAQCDTESYCYLPLLEETGYIPTQKYCGAREIFEHCQRIGRQFDLYTHAIFNTKVTELSWDDAAQTWVIHTDRGDAIRGQFVIASPGIDSRPKLPGIPGLGDFKGHMFHTSRWDYEYTGGDTSGGMVKLADKKVAIIGTGATAVQAIPYLARDAKHLYVFQRTPSAVSVRNNKPTDQQWVKTLTPGWQKRRRENFNDAATGRPIEEDLVNDGWTELFRNYDLPFKLGAVTPADADQTGSRPPAEDPSLTQAEKMEWLEAAKMEDLRARVDAIVKNTRTAELLKPWYKLFCKRPAFNDDYLDAFNRLNVKLVDTSGSKGVERITSRGIVANDHEIEVDCIIFSTGFERSTSFRRRMGFDIKGRAGLSLFDHWANGLRTFHGYAVHGFPNWFFMGPSQNGLSVNFTTGIDEQAKHIVHIINVARTRGAQVIEASAHAEDTWVKTIRSLAGTNLYFETCTPGYYNNEGKISGSVATWQGDLYAPGANAFHELIADWRERGGLEGLELDGSNVNPIALAGS